MVSPWPAGGRRAGGRRARGPQVPALTSGAGPEAVTRGAGPRSFPARAGDSFKRRAGCAAGPERSPNGARVPRRTRSGAGAAGQVRRARSARSPALPPRGSSPALRMRQPHSPALSCPVPAPPARPGAPRAARPPRTGRCAVLSEGAREEAGGTWRARGSVGPRNLD